MEKIDLEKFCKIANELKIEGFFYDIRYHDSYPIIDGVFTVKYNVFPYYDSKLDEWEVTEISESSGLLEFHYNLYENGLCTFGILGEGDHYFSTYIYSPIEFKQYISFINSLPNEKILNKKISFREFDFNDVIKGIYFTFIEDNGVKIIDFRSVKDKIKSPIIKALLIDVIGNNEIAIRNFLDDYEDDPVIKEIIDEELPISIEDIDGLLFLNSRILYQAYFEGNDWPQFCKKNDFKLLPEYYNKVSVLFREETLLPTNRLLISELPYLAFELYENFSSQYFFDFLYYSKNGEIFINELFKYLSSEKPVDPPKIVAPKNFIGQMTHSMSFRENYNEYLEEVSSRDNLKGTEIFDLKEIIKDRRDNFKEFILNKEKSNFLSSLKNPLPFIIEKSFRSFSRSSSDFDRQYHANRLYSIILKSIVLYPIQELLFLKKEDKFPEIEKILNAIKSGINISDGTWLEWFQNISKLYWKKEGLGLKYFNQIFEYFQDKHTKLFNKIILERNNFAHYRTHPKIFLQLLEDNLPVLLADLRSALINIDFILVENLNYTNGRLIVKAKKIVGFETDIETFEFETRLEPNYFASNKFYAHKLGMDYTIPLDPFFSVEFEKIETVKMGVFESFKNGNYQYIYGTETSI